MKRLQFLLALSVIILPMIVHYFSGRFYLGIDGGASIATIQGQNPTITYYNNQIIDVYPLNGRRNSTGGMWGLNIGYEYIEAGLLKPTIALGLGAYGTPGHFHYTGQVLETTTGSSTETLYNYYFQLASYRLMAETKFSWVLKYGITPLLDLGVGAAWNSLSDDSESVAAANTESYVTLPPFQSQTNVNLSYQIGIGLGYSFNFKQVDNTFQHDLIAIEYRYVSLGDNSFGTRGIEYPYSFQLGNMNTQEIFLSLMHVF
jgi:hypothetical protein